MLHALADKRCANFKTCGDLANEATGTSHVNIQILAELVDGKRKLRQGQCEAVRSNKERIEQLMAVPLIQGTLRYAYINDFEDGDEKAQAEGATFAASVLPLVYACDEDAADIIYENMGVAQAGNSDFLAVKAAFQSVYPCMKIRCEDVGGYYDTTTNDYLPHASPCGSSSLKEEEKSNAGKIAGISVGIVAAALLAYVVLRKMVGKHTMTSLDGDKVVA